jgi:hypothetical protein
LSFRQTQQQLFILIPAFTSVLGLFAHSACKEVTRLAYSNGVRDKAWQNVPQTPPVRAICAIGIIELDRFIPVQFREIGSYHALDFLDWDR